MGGFGGVSQADEVVGHDVLGAIEPESRDTVKHQAFVGYASRQDHVERGDAVGGDHQKATAGQAVGIPHLAAVEYVGHLGLKYHVSFFLTCRTRAV